MLPYTEHDKHISFFTTLFLNNAFYIRTSKPSHSSPLTTVSYMHLSSLSRVPTLPTTQSFSLNVPVLCVDEKKFEASHYKGPSSVL